MPSAGERPGSGPGDGGWRGPTSARRPATDRPSPPPPASAPRPTASRAGAAVTRPRPLTPTGRAGGVEHLGRQRVGVHAGRRRRPAAARARARRPAAPVPPAGRSARSTAAAGHQGHGSPGPRPPRHSGTVTASGPSRPVTRASGPPGPLVGLRSRRPRSRAGGRGPAPPRRAPGAGGRCRRWAGWRPSSSATLELPAHPLGEGRGGERALVAPQPLVTSPCSVSASTSTRVQDRPRPARRSWSSSARRLAAKAAVSTRSAGRVELDADGQVGWGRPGVGRAVVVARGQAVGARRRPSRSGPPRRWRGARPGRPGCARPSRVEHVGQVLVVQHGDGEGARKAALVARCDHQARPPGGAAQAAAKGAVGHPDPDSARRWRRRTRPATRRGQRLVATEVARRAPGGEGAHAGPGQLDPGRDGLDRAWPPASKARASRAGSWATSSSLGQRPWASRRRRPTGTPSARAAGDAGHHPVGVQDHGGHGRGPPPPPPPASPGTTPPSSASTSRHPHRPNRSGA